MIGTWKLVQEELRRVDYQGLLIEVQIAKGELEDKLRLKEFNQDRDKGGKEGKERQDTWPQRGTTGQDQD